MGQDVKIATPADIVKDAREELGQALHRVDTARAAQAAGEPMDLGLVISNLERAESKLEELEEALGL